MREKLGIVFIVVIAMVIGYLMYVQYPFDLLFKSNSSITPEKAKIVAERYIKDLKQYNEYDGDDISIIFEPYSDCDNCYTLGYEFILQKKKDLGQDYKGKIIINIKGNRVVNSEYKIIEGDSQMTTYAECKENHFEILDSECRWCPKKCQTLEGEIFIEESDNEIYLLLLNLKKQTQLDFNDIMDTEFLWNGDQEVSGIGFVVQDVFRKEMTLKEFFTNNGFEARILSDTLYAYQNDEKVCLVQETLKQQGEVFDLDSINKDIKVNCGIIEIMEEDNSTTTNN